MISAMDAGTNFADAPAPSPFQRVLLIFTAPSRAFAQLGSGGSWWLPYLLAVLIGLAFAATVGSKVSWETVARNNLAGSPKQQARFDQAPAAQQTQQIAIIAKFTRVATYAAFVIAPLVVAAIVAGILLATLNFALGGHARFGALFAVYMFSALPQLVKLLLAMLMLVFGVGTETFQTSNPLGSNPAFYLQGSTVPHWAIALLTWFDAFLIWQIVLLIIGCAVVAKVSRGKAVGVVLGWVILAMVISTAFAAFS